ncbi:MAG TPA: helix-turn-helix transcriptional regulator [Candidatus Limnocylindrales bacterium]|nr:helix-turn-helix transcriptional regulator [Candidatus Limnocylindrales bacterium]
MDDIKVGALIRVLRIRRGWRQADLAARSHVSRSAISRIERGHLDAISLKTLRSVARVLEVTIDLAARWQGANTDRILNAGHARLHEDIARLLDSIAGWEHAPEVSFSIYGERGVIDILAFHAVSGCLLVIELKTELASLEDLLTVMSRRRRLAAQIAAERGWQARTVSTWVVIRESEANERRIRRFAATLRAAFPANGHAIRSWLRHPVGAIDALSLWANAPDLSVNERAATRKRVRRP